MLTQPACALCPKLLCFSAVERTAPKINKSKAPLFVFSVKIRFSHKFVESREGEGEEHKNCRSPSFPAKFCLLTLVAEAPFSLLEPKNRNSLRIFDFLVNAYQEFLWFVDFEK